MLPVAARSLNSTLHSALQQQLRQTHEQGVPRSHISTYTLDAFPVLNKAYEALKTKTYSARTITYEL